MRPYRGPKKLTRNAKLLFAIGVAAVITCACAVVGVPVTGDPAKKLQDAYSLFDQQRRPLPAEELIRESIEIYQRRNDALGLAGSYRAYGFFFRSGAVEKRHKHYKEAGFLEDGATYANRHAESIKYFQKSAAIFERYNRQDALTNVYLNMGFTYEFAARQARACKAYEKSLRSNALFVQGNPGVKPALPQGYESYDEYVGEHMARLHCQQLRVSGVRGAINNHNVVSRNEPSCIGRSS